MDIILGFEPSQLGSIPGSPAKYFNDKLNWRYNGF